MNVSVVRVARRKIATTVLGTLVATAAVQGIAHAQPREVAVSTLGGATRFSGPMRGVDDLRAMAAANRTQITTVLGQAGMSDLATPMLNVLATGYISETTVAPGTHFEWMALKRAGRASLLRNVRWTGRQSFDAFQFSVESAGYTYTFIAPKVCGNFSLLSRTATPVAVVQPPRAPEPLPPPPPEPAPVAQAPPPPAPAIVGAQERTYPWIVTGYLGSSFGSNGSNQTVFVNPAVLNSAIQTTAVPIQTNGTDGGLTYGFQVAYLKRYVGGEFIAEFAPNFRVSSLALADEPSVNSWMFNVIGTVPIFHSSFEPFISGGVGGVTMRTKTFTADGANIFVGPNVTAVALNTINNTETKFAYDLGGGFFAYASRWGIRGDVRYYWVSTFEGAKLENGPTPGTDFTQSLLSGLQYWRANLGLSYRW
jgi:hypothetical protein